MALNSNKLFQTLFFILAFTFTQYVTAQTWTSAGPSPFAANGYRMTSASDGTSPYVLFFDVDYSYKLSVKKFDGTKWNYIGSPGFGNSPANVTIYSNGASVYVGYMDIDNGYKLTVKKFDGTDWVTVGQPGLGPQYLSSIKLAVVKNVLYASYYANGYVNVLTFDGTSWASLPNSNASTVNDNGTTVEIAAYKDTLARVYYSTNGAGVLVQTYKNNQWTTLGKTNLTSTYPYELAIDGNNRPYVVAGASTHKGVFVIRYNGVKWDTLGTVLAAGKNIQEASITFMSDNTPVVALGELDDALALIYPTVYKYQSNAWASFGSLKAVSTDDISIVSASNDMYVFYSQATSGTSDFNNFIFVNKFVLQNQTVTFNALPEKVIGDANFNLTAISSSGLPVTFASSNPAVATVNGNEVTIVGVGLATITATQAGSSFYKTAQTSQTLSVNSVSRADQTITFAPLPVKVYRSSNFAVIATASSGETVTFTSSNTAVATVYGNIVVINGVGSAIITAIQAGTPSYKPAISVDQTLTVVKADQTITFDALPDRLVSEGYFYLSASARLPVSYTSSNTSVATVSGVTVTIVGAGSTTITASQVGNANYNAAADVTQTLTVVKADQTIILDDLSGNFVGGPDFYLRYYSNSGLVITYTSSNTAVATISNNKVTIVGAGSTMITASQAGNYEYNPAPDVKGTMIVNALNKLDQTITFGTLSGKTVGDANFDLTATASSSLPVTYTSSNTAVATVSGNTVTIVGAGSTIITVSQTGDASFKSATDVTQTLTVQNLISTGNAVVLVSNSIELFPNPASNNLNLQFKNAFENVGITIYTLEGNTVYTKKIGSITNASADIEISSLTQGVYFVEIKSDQGTLVKRLIKQ